MYLDYTPEQKKLRDHLRTYFAEMMTPALREELTGSEGGGPLYQQALQKMGADGWLGIGWPKEYGGQGRTPIEQFIFSDEVQRAGFPAAVPDHQLGRQHHHAVRHRGAEARLPAAHPAGQAARRHRLHRAGGRHRPRLAAHQAVKDGDDYVINGSKVFTSLANYADYIWLAARTAPDAPEALRASRSSWSTPSCPASS